MTAFLIGGITFTAMVIILLSVAIEKPKLSVPEKEA